MMLQKSVIALALLSLFPSSAVAQDADNVNIHRGNLREMKDAAQGHNAAYSGSLFGLTRQQKKLARARYKQDLKMVEMKNLDNASKSANVRETGERENSESANAFQNL